MNASTGTLIWIGPRTSVETRDAFEYCQRHASQLTLRDSLLDAVTRPADAVRGIGVSRQARQRSPWPTVPIAGLFLKVLITGQSLISSSAHAATCAKL